jgi:hypothetical protein
MDRFDVLAILGTIVLSIGAGLIYLPAGLIVLGLAMLIAGIAGGRARGLEMRSKS